ncbi:isochorismatase family protein [Ornithinibacillus sp. L9]|uniref:Isochorismatase family protein n=1 Tax=Ornithinibacillus caprae TaxID=2678566 RepID=A0A6N8FM46_9BACI|nr:isochorismatase family cysteine hydrolase [Ornithinibacillus caprae]MUK90710.1 isochorismatase family protein [Ornithinibacillus caprae]
MNIKESALVLIDLQKESDFGLFGMEEVIQNTSKVIDACRKANIPIIYTRQINRAGGVALSLGEPLNDDGTPYFYNDTSEKIEIIDELKPMNNDIVIDKYRWSAFYETNLDLTLKSLGVNNILIGGVVTDGCLMTSVFDAYFRDYNVHLIKDLCTTSNEGAHMASLMIMANWVYNIKIYDTEDMINVINQDDYNVWEPTKVDSLPFTPDNMREVFKNFEQKRRGE